ncbi:MAG: EVE domain-containing protein [Acidobacteriaceae bacterium]
MPYLLKTEPSVYSFAHLRRDRETVWDGVSNPQAVKLLSEMQAGDRLVIYHTGEERAAVGTATVVSVDASDPKVPRVRIQHGKKFSPKTLIQIRDEASHRKGIFTGSSLLRQPRLSVVPLTEDQYQWLIAK